MIAGVDIGLQGFHLLEGGGYRTRRAVIEKDVPLAFPIFHPSRLESTGHKFLFDVGIRIFYPIGATRNSGVSIMANTHKIGVPTQDDVLAFDDTGSGFKDNIGSTCIGAIAIDENGFRVDMFDEDFCIVVFNRHGKTFFTIPHFAFQSTVSRLFILCPEFPRCKVTTQNDSRHKKVRLGVHGLPYR